MADNGIMLSDEEKESAFYGLLEAADSLQALEDALRELVDFYRQHVLTPGGGFEGSPRLKPDPRTGNILPGSLTAMGQEEDDPNGGSDRYRRLLSQRFETRCPNEQDGWVPPGYSLSATGRRVSKRRTVKACR